MLKKTRKIMSFILALIMLWMTAVPVFAVDFNSETSSENQLTNASNNVLYSVLGKDAPAEFCASLEAHGITINADTVIEVQEMSVNRTSASTYSARSGQPETTEVSGTGLVITNEEGATVTKTTILNLVEDSDTQRLTLSNESLVSNTYTDPFGDGTVTILMSVHYNRYQDETWQMYYQPVEIVMMYMDTSGVHDVSYVDVIYNCSGFLYSYPDFEEIEWQEEGYQYDWETYLHQAQFRAENPTHQSLYIEDISYAYERSFINEEGIEETEEIDTVFLLQGSPLAAHYISWEIYADGDIFRHSFPVQNPTNGGV